MTISAKCLFCTSEEIVFTIEFQPANITHDLCAFHAGVLQALEGLFKNPKVIWKRLK